MITRRDFVLGTLGLAVAARAGADAADIWERLRKGGLTILMRHASTEPGLGDPPGFKLTDCKTQRNLSDLGREEARRVGARFNAEKIPVAKVYTSPWCRCRETAMLAFGQAEDWEPLSSVFDFPHSEPDFTDRVKKRIANHANHGSGGNLIMVTHSVNIAPVGGVTLDQAEMLVMRADGCCGARPLERLKV
jgi:broad specificity phosphatase PhoE